jgi:putative iron-only hydrogenase system regulator
VNSRVGVISIIVEDGNSVETLNSILHTYGEYIIGRMGIPYREKGISIISIAIDAPQDIISTISGKIGNLKGVSAKTVLSNVKSDG